MACSFRSALHSANLLTEDAYNRQTNHHPPIPVLYAVESLQARYPSLMEFVDSYDATAIGTVLSAAKEAQITAYPTSADLTDDEKLATFVGKTQLSLVYLPITEIGLRMADDQDYWQLTSFQLGKLLPLKKQPFNFKISFQSAPDVIKDHQGKSVTRTFTHSSTEEGEELSLLQDYGGEVQATYCAATKKRPGHHSNDRPERSSSLEFSTTDRDRGRGLLTQRRKEDVKEVSTNTLGVTELGELPLDALGKSLQQFKQRAYELAGAIS